MREKIHHEVSLIQPLDELEARTQKDTLSWIASDIELCRLEKPATPPQHLIAYFVVVEGDYLLLVDHINAELWLPTGGHVEPGEHPRDTVLREAKEELCIDAVFLFDGPLFLTNTLTVGKTAGHTDVSLWYVLKGNREQVMSFDQSEFHTVQWFHKDAIPLQRSDQHMGRFLRKLYAA
ncbi:MAG: NUDIX domain-containing protein [Gammaproteobacteria bacterium]|nr:NUDIX domain-containing protein [Gammaproteobacteria bacterium]